MTKSATWLVLACALLLASCGPNRDEWDKRLTYLKADAHAYDLQYGTAATRREAVQRFHDLDLAIRGIDGAQYAFSGKDATVLRVEYTNSYVANRDFADPFARLHRMAVEPGSWSIYAITPNRRVARFFYRPDSQRSRLNEISLSQAQELGLDTKLALQNLPQL